MEQFGTLTSGIITFYQSTAFVDDVILQMLPRQRTSYSQDL